MYGRFLKLLLMSAVQSCVPRGQGKRAGSFNRHPSNALERPLPHSGLPFCFLLCVLNSVVGGAGLRVALHGESKALHFQTSHFKGEGLKAWRKQQAWGCPGSEGQSWD